MNDAATNNSRDYPDPSLPVGNAPPISPWLLVLAAAAWLAGIAFLLVMTSWRLHGS